MFVCFYMTNLINLPSTATSTAARRLASFVPSPIVAPSIIALDAWTPLKARVSVSPGCSTTSATTRNITEPAVFVGEHIVKVTWIVVLYRPLHRYLFDEQKNLAKCVQTVRRFAHTLDDTVGALRARVREDL